MLKIDTATIKFIIAGYACGYCFGPANKNNIDVLSLESPDIFRLKPQPEYREYTQADRQEILNTIYKWGDDYFTPVTVSSGGITCVTDEQVIFMVFEDFINKCTKEDGMPAGVKL